MKNLGILIIGINLLASCNQGNKEESTINQDDNNYVVIKAASDTVVEGQMYQVSVWLDPKQKDKYTLIAGTYNGHNIPFLRPNDTLRLEFVTGCKEDESGLNKRSYTIGAHLKTKENDSIWISQEKNYFTNCR
ncbi:hypothetical protein Q0590_37030 [Rhodocytophaga aerolata]|uniref:Uncharacterized protein n=1 Tax=Rhodocytophaga aerolata TaxID=455078 RepID=A0ABT8RLF4_9BACT|nr:hypothetical protein [Rhodocytophaga aerolata]MDO1451932.1 hypothetical protein [Rhodocytophaga aerolata]